MTIWPTGNRRKTLFKPFQSCWVNAAKWLKVCQIDLDFLGLQKFPLKETVKQSSNAMFEDGECCICFSLRREEKLPDVVCSNPRCSLVYHNKCIYQVSLILMIFFLITEFLNVFAVVYYVKREKGFQYHIRKLLQLWKNYQLFNSGLKPIKFKYFKFFFNFTNVSYFIQSVQVKLSLSYTNNTKKNNNLLLFCAVFKYE